MADMANEGSRVMTGSFLAALGACAAIVAVVVGLSELAGYLLRVVLDRGHNERDASPAIPF